MSPVHSHAEDDPSHEGLSPDDQRARSLIAAAQSAADRIAGELRSLRPLSVLPVSSHEVLLTSARALHAALAQLDGLRGGGVEQARPELATLDAVPLAYAVCEDAHADGVMVRVDPRATSGAFRGDGAALRRILRLLVSSAGAVDANGEVTLTVEVDSATVSFGVSWDDAPVRSAMMEEERAWLEREVLAQAGTLRIHGGRCRIRFAREPVATRSMMPDDLAREVLDLRRERDTFVHEVERTSSELQAVRDESEEMRRRFSRVEASMANAVNDLHRAFESLEAMAALMEGDAALRGEMLTAAQMGHARVSQLIDEVDAVAARSMPPWTRGQPDDAVEPGGTMWPSVSALQPERAPVFPELDATGSDRDE